MPLDITTSLTPPPSGGSGPQLPDAPVAIPLGNITVDGNQLTIVLPNDPNTYGYPVNSRGLQYTTNSAAPEADWIDQFQITSPVTVPASDAAALAFDTEYFIRWRVASQIPGESSTAGPWSPWVAVTTGSAPAYVAPTLTGVTATANGSSSYSGSATVNKAGTLYRYVSQNASETEATIVANGSAQAVNGAGSVPFSGSGLASNTTYYVHLAFDDGTNVVTASSGAFTTAEQGIGTGNVTIVQLSTMDDMVAPCFARYRADVTGASVSAPSNNTDHDRTHTELTYTWSFGDPDSAAGSDKVLNLPAIWNDHNVGYGKEVEHAHKTVRQCTIIVTVNEQDGTPVGSDSITVNIADPDTLYSGTSTVLVNAAGQGDAAYPGAQVKTTILDAIDEVEGRAQRSRILVKRGEDFDWGDDRRITTSWPNLRVGTYGTGSRPRFVIPSSNTFSDANQQAPTAMLSILDSFDSDIVFDGIDWVGRWDSVGLTGNAYRGITFTNDGSACQIFITDCKFSGFNSAIVAFSGSGASNRLFVHDTDNTNWRNYGMFLGSFPGSLGVVGCAIHQSEFANANGSGKNNSDNDHGPVRHTWTAHAYIACNDVFSNNGWTSNGGFATAQPCWRYFTTARTSSRGKTTFERNAFEGGYYSLSMNHQNANNHGGNSTCLVDKMLIVGTADTWYAIGCDYAGTTFRNVYAIIPDVPGVNVGYRNMLDHVYSLGFALDKSSPVQVYNCTQLCLMGDGNAASGELYPIEESGFGGSWPDYTLENCANFTPNRTGGAGETLSLETTLLATVGGTYQSRYVGRRDFPNDPLGQPNTAFASPSNFVTVPTPTAGSALIDDADTGLSAHDDFNGTVRTGTRDRGAVERP
ncbi:MAG: hypothetical protein AAGF32_03045 [Pseudomonadota bacterium]